MKSIAAIACLLTVAACTPAALSTTEPASFNPTETAPSDSTCETHTASVEMSVPEGELQVGDVVSLTVQLKNDGCVALGLPQYRITIHSDHDSPIFEPDAPEPIVHNLGVGPGGSDAAIFPLQAIAAGQAEITSLVSFEVHLNGAYWSSSSGEPLILTVLP